jgi:hypothetical protein
VRPARVAGPGAVFAAAADGERHRLACDLGFARGLRLGDLLDDVAIAVAGAEVHPHRRAGSARSVCSTLLSDSTKSRQFIAEQAQAPDAVAHRDLIGGLLARFELHQLLDRRLSPRRCSIIQRQHEARRGLAGARARTRRRTRW